MSHLSYFSYEGFGDRVKKDTHYSQAVKFGEFIEISGQGGWDRLTEEIPSDLGKQIDNVFDNVDHSLKAAGGKGWEQVYKIRCYVTSMEADCVGHIIRNLRTWCPHHQPLLTCVGVKELFNNMVVEIEVVAHVGAPETFKGQGGLI